MQEEDVKRGANEGILTMATIQLRPVNPILVSSNSSEYNHITQSRVTTIQKSITVMQVFA